jgi:GTPase SAR1 family protein
MNVHTIFLFGLENAGKKSLAQQIKAEEEIKGETSLAARINRMILKDTQFEIWHVAGTTSFEDAWNQSIISPKILMFILDVSDVNHFILAKKQLFDVLSELDTTNIPLIFCFHKMDLENAQKNYPKARDLFKLHQIPKRKVYAIQTSIKEKNQIQDLNNQIVDIIEKLRWE